MTLNDAVCCVDSAQFDSARSYGSGKELKEAMYGIGNLQSSPAMKTFYNKALLSAAPGSDMVRDFPLVKNDVDLLSFLLLLHYRSGSREDIWPKKNPTSTNQEDVLFSRTWYWWWWLKTWTYGIIYLKLLKV